MTRERQFGIDIMGAGGKMEIGNSVVNATVSSNSQKIFLKKSAIPLDLFNGGMVS